MKKLLVGLLALGTFSSFANTDCSLNVGDYNFKGEQLKVLKSKYDLTKGSARFGMQISGMCMGDGCDAKLFIKDGKRIYDESYGEEKINMLFFRGTILPKLGERSIKEAISNLRGCK